MAKLPYRPCVGVALFDRTGRVFVGRRLRKAGPEHVDDTHAWQMPNKRDAVPGQFVSTSYTGKHEQLRRVDRPVEMTTSIPALIVDMVPFRSISTPVAR